MTSYGIEYPICPVWVSHSGCDPTQFPVKINATLAEPRTLHCVRQAFMTHVCNIKYKVSVFYLQSRSFC